MTTAYEKTFGELIGSGPYQYYPSAFFKDDDSNAHRLFLAIMQVYDTLKNYHDIRDEDRELINAVGQPLEDNILYWGMTKFPQETTTNLSTRAEKYWSEFEGGGNEDSIKRAIYHYIGSGAFQSETWQTTTNIRIEDPSQDGTIYYYNDAGVSLWSTIASGPRDETVHYSYWSTNSDAEAFDITIYLISGTYDITDTRGYEYWNQTEKRLLLRQVVNLVKPLGIKFRIKVEVR